MLIKVLGPGCTNCKKLEANTIKALRELGIEEEVIKVTDVKEFMKYGVLKTPALVVDEKVKFYGRVPSSDEIKKYIK